MSENLSTRITFNENTMINAKQLFSNSREIFSDFPGIEKCLICKIPGNSRSSPSTQDVLIDENLSSVHFEQFKTTKNVFGVQNI